MHVHVLSICLSIDLPFEIFEIVIGSKQMDSLKAFTHYRYVINDQMYNIAFDSTVELNYHKNLFFHSIQS